NVESGALSVRLIAAVSEIERLPEKPRRIAIDMPMGFANSACRGGRDCERAARALLPGKSSSVFSLPCRAALVAKDYDHALKLNRASGPDYIGLSMQAFNLFEKLKQLDEWITPQRQQRCIEAHPELAFARLNGGKPVLSPKRKPEGRAERQRLLRRTGIAVPRTMLETRPKGSGIDDLLDALVLTRTAERHLRGNAVCLPEKPPRDARGLKMEIWY
ncbi:MAG: pyridoxal kinase, partial [Alphaproteobacteria bacterium]|nr:pyridoxal kinase [Alphaproteobacteria bacterium]